MTNNLKRQYFNELAPRWDTLPSPSGAAARVRDFVRRALQPEARRILDVGCGTGLLLPHLIAERPDAQCIVEFDLAEAMLAENARNFADRQIIRVCGAAEELPFRRDSFDVILCFGVLPHLLALEQALRHLLDLLAPRGVLSVGHLMASGELNAFHQGLGQPVAGDYLPPAVELGRLLEDAGAVKVVAEENPGWYFVRGERAA